MPEVTPENIDKMLKASADKADQMIQSQPESEPKEMPEEDEPSQEVDPRALELANRLIQTEAYKGMEAEELAKIIMDWYDGKIPSRSVPALEKGLKDNQDFFLFAKS